MQTFTAKLEQLKKTNKVFYNRQNGKFYTLDNETYLAKDVDSGLHYSIGAFNLDTWEQVN